MKNKKIDIKDALTGLDIVHADLWLKRETLRKTKTKGLVVKEIEIECLITLVETVMKQLGFDKEFTK